MGGGDGRHADDGVHGRADVVAHVGKKLAFGHARGPGPLQRALQRLALLLLLIPLLVDAPGEQDGQRVVRIGVIHIDDLG